MTNQHIPLTKDEVATLRQLGRGGTKQVDTNAIVVHYMSDTDEFEMYVCASMKPVPGSKSEPLYSDVRFHFAASGAVRRFNGDAQIRYGEEEGFTYRLVGQEMFYKYSSHDGSLHALTSIANIIKVGDGLHIKFVVGNSTETLKKNDLQQDEAYISVRRGDRLIATFPVDFRVSPRGGFGNMLDSLYRGKAAS